MKNYRVSAPPRIAAVGFGPGRGGTWPVGGPAPAPSSSNPITDAINAFGAGALVSAQVGLGVLLIGLAVLIVISQTSAGRAAGGAAKGGARLGLRAIPGVGILA